uniref:Reverse transcriptase domain-containing protein n=1 Tax=Tanacetum cinerariifolium TaxID=118510 RepID=A0A699KQY0_TANCI|nr:hypothetical protein [Tanacetum cinerariifolium]
MNQNSYNANSLGFDQPQPPQSPVIHQPPQELSIQEMEDLKQQYLDELKCLSNLEYHDEIKIAKLKENFNVTPSLSIEEPDNSLSMGDEHLDTILATKSDEVIKSSVENPIPIPNQFEDLSESNDEFSSINDDSLSIDNIDYVEASPPDSKLVSSEVMEIVIPEVGGIDDDILLTIKDDILREKLLNVNLLIAKIEALNANPTPSSDCKTKSSSTSLNSLLEETNTFDNSLPKFETFCFEVEEISSGSTTTHSDISLPEYEAFYDDHVKEIFLPFLVSLVAPHYLLSLRNEDTIFDPGICNSHFSRPDVSHQCGTFLRFKVLLESPMEIFSSTCSPIDQ